jgi:large subunit ribosomal protein L21
MNYAIIRTGGKQYRVAPGDIIRIERLDGDPGAEVAFTDVLMTAHDGALQVGKPLVAGARVTGQVIQQGKAKKILVFKKKKRKNYRRHRGHRQLFTAVRVTQIEAGADSQTETGAESHGA